MGLMADPETMFGQFMAAQTPYRSKNYSTLGMSTPADQAAATRAKSATSAFGNRVYDETLRAPVEHVSSLATILNPNSTKEQRALAGDHYANSLGNSLVGMMGYTMKSGRVVPDYLVKQLQNPWEVANAVSIKTQGQAKKMLAQELPEMANVRMTDVGELNGLMRGDNAIGRNFEGQPGISAQQVGGQRPILAYGRNDMVSASKVYPDDAVIGRGVGPNEVMILPDYDASKTRYGLAGEGLFSYNDLLELFKAQVP
jgi:hypothetical protein